MWPFSKLKRFIINRIPSMSKIGLIIIKIWDKFGLRVPSRFELVRLLGVATMAAATTFCGRAVARFVGGRINRRRYQRSLHRLDPYLPLDRRGRHARHHARQHHARQHHARRNLARGIDQEHNLLPILEDGVAPIGFAPIIPPPQPVIEAPPLAADIPPAHFNPPAGQPIAEPQAAALQGQQQPGFYQLPPEEIDEETGLPKAFVHRELPCTRAVWAELLVRGKVPPINFLQLPPLARGNRGNAIQQAPAGGQP